MKKLTCRAMGMNCGFEVRDESEEEILRTVGDHAKRVHKIEFKEELLQKAKDLIRFVEV
jgi:predicted small metal-binding protein